MTKNKVIYLAMMKALGANEHWITVHPNGADSRGQPLLIRDNPDGSASVLGGAGGKLNYLRLTGVKSKEQYKQHIQERHEAVKARKREQVEADKKAGVHEAKQEAKRQLTSQRRTHEQRFISTVASAMGWNEDELELKPESLSGLSDKARTRAIVKHHQTLLKRAKEAVNLQRQRLITDAEARADAGLGEVPLFVSPEQPEKLSVADLRPETDKSPAGLGYATNYKQRAEAEGMTAEDKLAEIEAVRGELSPEERQAAIRRGETHKLIQQELEGLRMPAPDTNKILDAREAMNLLKAEKQLKAAQKQAREAGRDLDKATEPKAYVIEVDDATDNDIKEDLSNDLRTIQTRHFLNEVGKTSDNPTEALGRHIGVGAYNSINSLSLAVSGDSMMDRSVIDVLGIAGAAQVLARRIHTDMPDDVQNITDAMEDYHLHHYMEASKDAMAQANEFHEFAKEIELGEAANGADLEVAAELNSKRREALNNANRALGQALGEMEANAALVKALREGASNKVQVPLGDISIDAAITQARALGLLRGDYQIERAGRSQVLTVNGSGMDKLASSIDRSSAEQIRRNLDIIEGRYDEDAWLPQGFANRPDLDLKPEPGVAPRLAISFAPSGDIEQSMRDYIGSRTADGDTPEEIVSDLQSLDFIQKAGASRADEYLDALERVAPLKGEDGKRKVFESMSPAFESMADEFAERHMGGKIPPIHKQKIDVDAVAVDALHRALSAEPAGAVAYKQLGNLTPQDQRAIRDYFAKNVAKESPDAANQRQDIDRMEANEPLKEVEDMFGESATNPEWSEWRGKLDNLKAEYNTNNLSWSKYVESMGGTLKAYETVQDLIRSKVSKEFATAYNTLKPDRALKVGRTVVANHLDHADMLDPNIRAERSEKERALIDGLRERVSGRYASGSVSDKLAQRREDQASFEQAQLGMFSTEESPEGQADKEPGIDERYTLGHEAERQIAAMMKVSGQNFKPGQPLKLWQPSMNGKGVARQRAIKYLAENKRMSLAFGVGSGKSAIMLGGFSHLHAQGKVKKGLFLVPSIVQGQFSGEALRYIDPNSGINWHINPGAGRDERIAAYKDPEKHFSVMTHQSFRDDMIHLASRHEGIEPSDMAAKYNAMTEPDRKAWMKGVMDKEGINFDFLAVDEGHNMLNREGKANSTMANVADAVSAHTPYFVSASGDPVKNDASELFDLMHKMDSTRYSDRAAFMRKYGVDTDASKEALRREMARYVFPSKVDSGVNADRKEIHVDLSEGQQNAMTELSKHIANARIARMTGGVDVDAVKAISPDSFDGVPADQHETLAKQLSQSIGILKQTAERRIIDEHEDSAKMTEALKFASERNGKPGIVFARSLSTVKRLTEKLQSQGFRVASITGADSSADKEAKRQAFNPDSGNDADAKADILIASDAAATGINAQRGQWLLQYDTPQTALTHAQRQGRIDRTGQKNDIELADLVANHATEHNARSRLRKKYGLRELLTTPLEGLDDTGIAYFLKQRREQADQGSLF